MECPHCDETLRVIDRRPAPPGTFIRMTCPARTCGQEFVARVHDDTITPMTRGQARSQALRVVFVALRADFTFPIAGAVGTALLTAFLALWQFLNPADRANNPPGVLAIIAGGAAVVAVFAISILGDLVIGVRGWRNALPRPVIDVKTMPRDYRT